MVDLRRRSIRAVDNTRELEPTEFDKPQEGQTVPRLGSADLLRLAANAENFGYHLAGIALRDRSMSPLPQEADERLSEELTEAIRQGQVEEAQRLLLGERGPLAVVSIHMIGELDDDVHVGRLGVFASDSAEAMRKLIAPAWKRLQLS
ncbi:hypothetical protein HR12_40545 [Microbacterium sp. SUBG005]|nr:hypothetical protein HR12_40545 [Microbacterium sp. SUBG005]